MNTYLRDPAAIYAQSFATIAAEVDLARLPPNAHAVATRMVHACGMVDLVDHIVVTDDFAPAAQQALSRGCEILVDAEMVRHGIIPSLLPDRARIICTLNDPRARDIGIANQTTRSAAAVALWHEHLEGAIVAIGNAPTALFALLEAIDAGAPKPAAIIGCPVGFVGAAESKAELIENPRGIPFITVTGRMGGSAIASSAVNALLGNNA